MGSSTVPATVAEHACRTCRGMLPSQHTLGCHRRIMGLGAPGCGLRGSDGGSLKVAVSAPRRVRREHKVRLSGE